MFVDLEGFEQNVFLGIHDGQGIFETLRGVIGGVHVDMHSAGVIDHRTGMAKGSDNLLQLFHFAVFEFWGVHFHLVFIAQNRGLPSALLPGCTDAGIVHNLPDLVLPVRNLIDFVGPAQIPELSSEQSAQRFRCLPPGDSRHLNFTAIILLF